MTRLIFMLGVSMIFFGTQPANALGSNERHLFSRCAPMGLVVEKIEKEVPIKELARDYIVFEGKVPSEFLDKALVAKAAESRLRAARLFKKNASQYLYVNVKIVSLSFAYSLSLYRRIEDTGFGRSGTLPVWRTEFLPTLYTGGPNLILEPLSERIDSFIATYLRANEGHCAKS